MQLIWLKTVLFEVCEHDLAENESKFVRFWPKSGKDQKFS